MRLKLITASAAALRRLLTGEDREYRIDWIAAEATATDQQGTGNAPETREARRARIQALLGTDPEEIEARYNLPASGRPSDETEPQPEPLVPEARAGD